MNFEIIQCEQGTPEWRAARAGRVTGSRAADFLAKGKGGAESAGRRNLRATLVTEILTGLPEEEGYVSDDMKRGSALEPMARMAYEERTGNLVRQTGFLSVNGMRVGCSLDGDVDEFEGITEFKCPKTATHIAYLIGGVVPSEHVSQITHGLLVSGAKWCDFVSYDDRLPKPLRLFVVRVMRDEAAIAAYRAELDKFLVEVEALLIRLEEFK